MNIGLKAAGKTQAGESSTPPRSRFAWQVAWTLAVRVLMAANSLAAGIVVARWLGADGLGTLAALNVTIALTIQIGSMGLPSANTYFVAQDRRTLSVAALNSLVFAIFAGGALAFVTTALVGAGVRVFGEFPVSLFVLAAASIPFQLLTVLGLNLFLALGRIGRFNLLDVTGQSFVLVNAILALVVLRSGLQTLVALNTAAAVLLSLVVGSLVWRYIAGQKETGPSAQGEGERRVSWRGRAAMFRQMMRYGLKVHLQTVASLLLFRVDLLVVKTFRGAAEAGVYSVASQVALLLMLLPGVIATLLFPRVAGERDETGALACRVTRYTMLIMLAVCLAAVPAVFALPLLYGAAFDDAIVQSLILLPGVLLVSVGGVLAQHFSGTGLPIALPLFWTVALLFNTALNLAFVPAYGARAAALSSSISYSLVFALIAFYFRRRTGRALADAFLLRGDELRALLSSARRGLLLWRS